MTNLLKLSALASFVFAAILFGACSGGGGGGGGGYTVTASFSCTNTSTTTRTERGVTVVCDNGCDPLTCHQTGGSCGPGSITHDGKTLTCSNTCDQTTCKVQ
jgi:hypothetical protein